MVTGGSLGKERCILNYKQGLHSVNEIDVDVHFLADNTSATYNIACAVTGPSDVRGRHTVMGSDDPDLVRLDRLAHAALLQQRGCRRVQRRRVPRDRVAGRGALVPVLARHADALRERLVDVGQHLRPRSCSVYTETVQYIMDHKYVWKSQLFHKLTELVGLSWAMLRQIAPVRCSSVATPTACSMQGSKSVADRVREVYVQRARL